jgi:hypothetical protein
MSGSTHGTVRADGRGRRCWRWRGRCWRQPRDYLTKIRELYEGTRLGRQELRGAMILDPQNAPFKGGGLIQDEVAVSSR